MKTYLRLLGTFTLLLFLSACHLLDIKKQDNLPSFTTTQGTAQQLLDQSTQQSNIKYANQYRLIAANKFLQQNDLTKAKSALEQLKPDLTDTQKMLAEMLTADIALRNKDSATAAAILSSATFYQLDEQDTYLQVRVRLLKAKAFEQEGKLLQALRERSYISSFLTGQEVIDNQNNIWRLAMSLPLDVLQTAADSGETGGWLQLAKAVKGASTLKEQQDNIAQWMKDNPNHPATKNPPEEITKIQQLSSETISKIAILLPQNEKYAQAIYNGFIAAYYQSNDKDKVTIKPYESTSFASMDAFYEQAKKDGIQLVIGPIEKNLVNELSKKPQLPITTLALNYADGNIKPPQLFQFGLLPEDEAREVATRAWADGRRHAVAVVPQGEWGKKVLAAFRQNWERQGGVIDGIQYIDRPVDLDKQLIGLLQKLPGNGAKSTSEDDNFLFMVADPLMARQVRALLVYRDADQLPVYATSHIYSGVPDAIQDHDLNGVLFTETPWLLNNDNPLQEQIISQWPQAQTSFARLYALGVDTWSIAPRLMELKSLPNSSIMGLSGELTINSTQRVERKLPWATFTKGLIQPAVQNIQ